MKNRTLTKLIVVVAILTTTTIMNLSAQIAQLKYDPVGNYLGVLLPVSHTNPFSGPFNVTSFFKFSLDLDSTGVRTGTGVGSVFVSGKKLSLKEASFVAPTLTLQSGNPVLNKNGDIDFYITWSASIPGIDGDTEYVLNGVLKRVPSSTPSIYFRKVTHKDAAAQLKSTETVGMFTATTLTTCTVEASGGRANLSPNRVRIFRTRPNSSRSFFKS